MIFSQRWGNVLFGSALAGMLAVLLTVNPAQAVIYQWTGAYTSDMLTAGNWNVWDAVTSTWSESTTLPGSADNADFVIDSPANHNPNVEGTFNVRYLQFADETLTEWPAGSGGGEREFTGGGNIVLPDGGNIDTWMASGTVTFSNAYLQLTRRASLYAATSGGSSAGNLVINTTTFAMGYGSGSGTPSLNAVGADLTVNSVVDFSGSSTNRQLNLNTYAGRTITLAGGVTASSITGRLTGINVRGEATGKVVLGDMSNFTGAINVWEGDLEISDAASSGGGWTQVMGGDSVNVANQYSGAVLLTGGVTYNPAGALWLSGRLDSNTAPHVRSVSGANEIAGTVFSDVGGWAGGTNSSISSEGTEVGDFLTVSAPISLASTGYYRNSTNRATSGTGNWIFEGAGDGLASGGISESDPANWQWSVVKKGAGTWTLSGAISYTNSTTVEEGTLLINGADASTGAYTVLAAGTLGGTGSIAGSATVEGTLAPGASIESFDINGDVTLTGTLDVEYSGTGAGSIDLLNVAGLLDLTGSTISFSDYDLAGSLTGAAYVFATYGSLAGTSTEVGVPDGYSVNYAYGGNNIALVAIPEPSTMILLVLAGLALAAYRRRVR